MESKAVTMVLVKFTTMMGYIFKMGVAEIYPSNTQVDEPIDFENEAVYLIVPTMVLNGSPLKELTASVEKIYITSLEAYVMEKWDLMDFKARTECIEYAGLRHYLSGSMNAKTMKQRLRKKESEGHNLYLVLANMYDYIARFWN